jgi:hypothetical protein
MLRHQGREQRFDVHEREYLAQIQDSICPGVSVDLGEEIKRTDQTTYGWIMSPNWQGLSKTKTDQFCQMPTWKRYIWKRL